MSLHKNIFSENIKELEFLIKKKFENGLKSKFGHSNFPFQIKNIKINKFKRINVTAIFDKREIEENKEINYGGVNRIRTVHRNNIDTFSFIRKNCKIKDLDTEETYRVEDTDESHTCGRCSGKKEVTCFMCSGNGRNRCGTCNGKREIRCSNCYGKGETRCFWCSGKGTKKEGYGQNERIRTCNSCNGKGFNKCSSCSNGYNICGTCNGNGEVSCYKCGSSGKIGCSTCASQGSFTKYFVVKSIINKKESDLVIEGNNPGDFIIEKLISEEFKFENDFLKYKISKLSEYKTQLRELLKGLPSSKNERGTMIYSSLEECASLTFEIIVGGATYLGNLKDGNLNIDESSFDLLFYDIIDEIKIDSKFSNLLENRSAFEGNLSNTKKLWDSIKQYQSFENILSLGNSKNIFNISDKNLPSNKIAELRKLYLINAKKYINILSKKFIKNEILRQSLATFISIYILTRIFGSSGGIEYLGFSNFIKIPFIFLFLSVFLAFTQIKAINNKPKKRNATKNDIIKITIFGYILVITGFIVSCFSLSSKSDELKLYLQKKKEEKIEFNVKLTNIENFKKFKKGKTVLSSTEFKKLVSILNNRSFNTQSISDSMIVIRPSQKLKYDFYIEAGKNYKRITNTHCSDCGSRCYGHEKISNDKLFLSIDYESFIENSGYYKYSGGIKVNPNGSFGFFDYEVRPSDIKFKVSKYGITSMRNSLEDYSNNKLSDYYISPESFSLLFPNSELINIHSRKIKYFTSSGELITELIKEDNLNELDSLNIKFESKESEEGMYEDELEEIIKELEEEDDMGEAEDMDKEKEDMKEAEDMYETEDMDEEKEDMKETEDMYEDEEIFIVVENMPLYPGCNDEICTQSNILRYIRRNFKYPPMLKGYGIEGKVIASFVVNKKGKASDIKILRGLDKEIDDEIVRVIKSLPDFTPGKKRNKPANVRYTIPINVLDS